MPDCIIIGGGIIGLLTARALHLEGVNVLLIERGRLGGESSWAGGGIISPLCPWDYDDAVNVLAERSRVVYPSLVECLYDESGIDCELLNSGMFIVDGDYQQARQWAERWQAGVHKITDAKQVHSIEPAINQNITKGVWLPDIMQVRNPKLVQALRGSFETLSIPYRENTEVKDIIIEAGRVQAVQTVTETISADKVIVASGAWSAKLVKTTIDIEPVKGQMIMLKGQPDRVHRIIYSNGHYIIPRRDGYVLAGSTLEKTGFDKSTTETAQRELHADAVSLVPALAELPIERHWAGLRPGTKRGVPYICEHDDVAGLYIHAGHYRNGIVLGPASTELMVELVLERRPSFDPKPYTLKALH